MQLPGTIPVRKVLRVLSMTLCTKLWKALEVFVMCLLLTIALNWRVILHGDLTFYESVTWLRWLRCWLCTFTLTLTFRVPWSVHLGKMVKLICRALHSWRVRLLLWLNDLHLQSNLWCWSVEVQMLQPLHQFLSAYWAPALLKLDNVYNPVHQILKRFHSAGHAAVFLLVLVGSDKLSILLGIEPLKGKRCVFQVVLFSQTLFAGLRCITWAQGEVLSEMLRRIGDEEVWMIWTLLS